MASAPAIVASGRSRTRSPHALASSFDRLTSVRLFSAAHSAAGKVLSTTLSMVRCAPPAHARGRRSLLGGLIDHVMRSAGDVGDGVVVRGHADPLAGEWWRSWALLSGHGVGWQALPHCGGNLRVDCRECARAAHSARSPIVRRRPPTRHRPWPRRLLVEPGEQFQAVPISSAARAALRLPAAALRVAQPRRIDGGDARVVVGIDLSGVEVAFRLAHHRPCRSADVGLSSRSCGSRSRASCAGLRLRGTPGAWSPRCSCSRCNLRDERTRWHRRSARPDVVAVLRSVCDLHRTPGAVTWSCAGR